MANVNHTEMIEEDAADLQFPKGKCDNNDLFNLIHKS